MIEFMEIRELLLLAKKGDTVAKEKLIEQYYGLIVAQSKGIFLNSYSFDDLVQTGIESLLKAIKNFDLEKGGDSFTGYVFWCIKNNFSYLCRKEIRYNNCSSLNITATDDLEIIDLIQDTDTLEDVVFKSLSSKALAQSLETLNEEELSLISFLYLNNSSDKKEYLSNYAKLKGKDYYQCTLLKKETLHKLKSAILNHS